MAYGIPVATHVFNGFSYGGRVLRKYDLDGAFDRELQAVRINERVIAILPELFTGNVRPRFVKEYYAANGGSSDGTEA